MPLSDDICAHCGKVITKEQGIVHVISPRPTGEAPRLLESWHLDCLEQMRQGAAAHAEEYG